VAGPFLRPTPEKPISTSQRSEFYCQAQRISSLIWKFPLRIILDWAAAVHFLLTGSGIHAKAIFIAQMSFVRRFGHEMKKRANTGNQIKNFEVANIYKGLIVFDYFLSGKKSIKI